MSRSPHDDSDPYGIDSQGHTVGAGKPQRCDDKLQRSLRDTWNRLQEHVQNEYTGCNKLKALMNDVAGAIAAEIILRAPQSAVARRSNIKLPAVRWGTDVRDRDEMVVASCECIADADEIVALLNSAPQSAKGARLATDDVTDAKRYRMLRFLLCEDASGDWPSYAENMVDLDQSVDAEISRRADRSADAA